MGSDSGGSPLPRRVPAAALAAATDAQPVAPPEAGVASGDVTAGRPREFIATDTPPPSPSQMVRVLPVAGGPGDPSRTVPGAAGRRRQPRFLGLPLPAWVIIAAVSLGLIICAVVILPRLRPGTGPAEVAHDGGVGVVGGVDASASNGVEASTGATGSPGQTIGPSATVTPTVTPVPLEIADFTTVNQLLRWRVTITIRNPAAFPQEWHNASVQVDQGLGLLLEVITAGTTVYDAGRTVCVAPTAPATIEPNGTVVVEFNVGGLSSAPHGAQVENPTCARSSD